MTGLLHAQMLLFHSLFSTGVNPVGEPVDSRKATVAARNASRVEQYQVQPLLVSVEEAAIMLGIGRTHCYEKLILKGVIASLKIGNSRRVVLAAIHEYIREQSGR